MVREKNKIVLIASVIIFATIAYLTVIFLNKQTFTYTVSFDTNGGTTIPTKTLKPII
jgi:hypothetical protein